MPVVVQIDAYDPVLPGTVTLRMASDDSDLVCHLNGQTWWPVLDRLPLLAMDFFGGEFGQVTTAAASMSLSVETWPDFARYAFPDARLQLWHGDYGAAWASYTLRFDGRVTSQPVIEDGRAQIGFAVDDKWLDTPLLSTYAGTGSAEGPAAAKGTPKPLAIGAPMGVPGVMLDPIKSIIQLSAYGAIESVDVPLERLARQFGSPLADYANYAALDAATVPAGQWATCKAAGLVRMGAPPYGKLCFLMKGDKGGVDGWVRRPGAIIKRLASIAGGASKVSETAVDALDTARPYDISLYYDGQISARQAIQDVAASVNAVAGVSLTGQLITVPVQINATGLTYRADGSTVPMLSSVRSLGISAPWWRLAIGAQPFWDVHSQGDYIGLQITAAYPDPPPEVMQDGGIYIDATKKQYRYIGPNVFSDEGDAFSDEGLITSSGYEDIQDAAIAAAADLAALGIVNAANAQATANGANALAVATSSNFNSRNDRNGAAVVVPTIAGDGTAIDHVANPTGTVDVSFEWAWSGAEADIDGFQVLARNSASASAYTIGSAPAEESVFTVPASRRAQIFYGVDPTRYYTFAVRAFRVVDPDIDASGLLLTAWVKSTASGENPYQPSANVAFVGDVSGTVNGIVPTRNVNRGAWSSASVAYAIGDIVDRAGSSYAAITAHTSSGANGPPGANWTLLAAEGGAGPTGPVAPILTCSPPAWPIACTFNGTPKSAVPGFQINVFQGTTNVSASASYGTITAVGISGAAVDSDGTVTVTGMTAETGYVEIPVTYSGVTLLARVDYTKVRDGNAAVSGSANVTSLVNTGTYGTSASFNISLANGQSFNANANVSYDAASSTYTPQIKLAYVNVTDGGAETDMAGSEVTGGTALPTDFETAATSGSFTNSSGGTKVFNIRLLTRRSSGAGNSANVTGSVGGSG